ncbi:MAG: hypothetical protein GXO74_15025 [Calditrichaeota bacterium]|nr:hypothetical protein [Calditrichota bacterium]
MAHRKKSALFPGVFLILLGIILLLYKLMPNFFGWRELYPLILLVLGIWLVIEAMLPDKKDRGAIFPGTILLLLGLFFSLRNYDLIPFYYVREVWPIFLIILGFAFLALFLVNPRDQGSLIPASLFLFFGVILLLRKLSIIDWEIGNFFADYWPVILIFVGLGIIANSLRRPGIDEN